MFDIGSGHLRFARRAPQSGDCKTTLPIRGGKQTLPPDLHLILEGVANLEIYNRNDSLVWIVPIAVRFFFPILIIVGSPFLPESPRWLIQKGRHEDGFRSFRRLSSKDVTDTDVRAELDATIAGYEHHKAVVASTSWIQLFRGTDLRRTLIGVGVMCLIQGRGISFTNNYLNITLISLGFSHVYELLVIIYAAMIVISFLGFYLPDKVGRRPLLLYGFCVMLGCMVIIGACAAGTDNKPTGSLGKLTLAGTFIWILVYSLGPVSWLTASEISSSALREKTLALSAWGCFVSGLISNICVPYIQDADYGNLQGQIAFVFAGITVFAIVFCLFIPELKGRSLEDLDLMFEAKIPARRFQKYDIHQLRPENQGTELEAPTDDKLKIEENTRHVETI
ncbi:uncharacterized protein I303_107373 [Kwoniella dejecticola CBS 10117]|uniref:Major facilitator superfamily (MFS) profile domain-containing protein n=1 Tax=Kwoniella dejecticola CBS 10117 TaxID=1296121 RepID=A0AAJ8MKU5_9TREE